MYVYKDIYIYIHIYIYTYIYGCVGGGNAECCVCCISSIGLRLPLPF
jgi:hypothetical protein